MKALTVMVLVIATIWCAGSVVLVAIAAPGIFHHAPPQALHLEREMAGAIFGSLLSRWNTVVDLGLLPILATLALVAAGSLIATRRYLLAIFYVVMIIGIGSTHLWSRAILLDALASAPPLDHSQPYTAEQRQQFNDLHARSTRLYGTETVLLLLFVLGVGIGLSRRDEQSPASSVPAPH